MQITSEAFSSDIQQVNLVLSVNYCIDQNTAQVLYRTVGANYYENVMYPRILENTKAVFSRYTAENLIARRNSLSDSIAEDTRVSVKNQELRYDSGSHTVTAVDKENSDVWFYTI